jgi:hypothetical protein
MFAIAYERRRRREERNEAWRHSVRKEEEGIHNLY